MHSDRVIFDLCGGGTIPPSGDSLKRELEQSAQPLLIGVLAFKRCSCRKIRKDLLDCESREVLSLINQGRGTPLELVLFSGS
jgi:hypothetical protein